jgi:hypothetical protein
MVGERRPRSLPPPRSTAPMRLCNVECCRHDGQSVSTAPGVPTAAAAALRHGLCRASLLPFGPRKRIGGVPNRTGLTGKRSGRFSSCGSVRQSLLRDAPGQLALASLAHHELLQSALSSMPLPPNR